MRHSYTNRRDAFIKERIWQAWCKKRAQEPKMRRFALLWADTMEAILEPNVQFRHIAERAMGATEGVFGTLPEHQLQEVVHILALCWCNGARLREWAVGEGIVER